MNDDIAKFIWWVKRSIANGVIQARSPEHVRDVYEAAQAQTDENFRQYQGRIEMDERQIKVLQGYIRRTIERREKISAGKPNDLEAMKAQQKDDAVLRAALVPEWMDLI